MSGRRDGRSLFGKRERRKTILLVFDVLTVSLLLKDQCEHRHISNLLAGDCQLLAEHVSGA